MNGHVVVQGWAIEPRVFIPKQPRDEGYERIDDFHKDLRALVAKHHGQIETFGYGQAEREGGR